MSDNKNQSSNRKSDLLSKEVEHIDITSFDARKIVSSMEKMSFVSRETANAANIYNEMIKDKDCTIFLTLAGSTSAAGCMHIYRDLVKYNMVDAIVATGASIIDMDFFEALGFKHYQGSQYQDDTELRNNYVDRIYLAESFSHILRQFMFRFVTIISHKMDFFFPVFVIF